METNTKGVFNLKKKQEKEIYTSVHPLHSFFCYSALYINYIVAVVVVWRLYLHLPIQSVPNRPYTNITLVGV